MLKFKIKVDGHEYEGVFDAIDRFPGARRISVTPC